MKSAAFDPFAEKPKRVRNAPDAGTAGPAPDESSLEPQKKTLADMKSEALNLFEDKPKKKRVEGAQIAPGLIVPISQIIQDREDAEAAKNAPPPPPVVVPAPQEAPADSDEDGEDSKIICIKPPIVIKELAARMNVKAHLVMKDLIDMEIFTQLNGTVEPDIAAKLCEKHGFIFEREKREKGAGIHKVEEVIAPLPPPPEEQEQEQITSRAPIITFMGHVDHGKTSLIDAIRSARVVAGEAGGITQHIGAYSVEHNGGHITILDTPGHAAFSAMRARGAHITDIVVLVVAADDGMMPQTKEALAHAKAAGVKIVVAINKCDLATANIDRVKMQLQENGLSPEDWGGDTICIPVSATKRIGIDTLLENTLLEAELLELKANPKAPCRALVIESRVEAGKGPTATVIPRTGTIKVGMPFICGPHHGKVKSMLDDSGKPVKFAGPATPVEVIGFSDMPNVGDELVEMESERDAKRLSEERSSSERMQKLKAPRRAATLENFFASMETSDKKTLKVVLKTDVQGSLEAVIGQLREIESKTTKVKLDIILSGVGPISESDIILASASSAVVIGFNQKVEGKAVKVAKAESVQVKLYSIIYELIDQVREAMTGLLDPELREKVIGHAVVKQIFKINRARIGGSQVTDGRLVRKARARVLRGKQPVYDGGFHTLRRFTEDVDEVRNGLECGIRLGDFNEYEVGDIIECYELEKIQQAL